MMMTFCDSSSFSAFFASPSATSQVRQVASQAREAVLDS